MCFRANCHPAQLSRLHRQVGGKPTQDGFISKCSFPFKNTRYTQTFLKPAEQKREKHRFHQKQPIWPTRGGHPPIFHGHFGMPWHPSQRPRSWPWPPPPASSASMAPCQRCWGCGRRARWGRTPFRRFKFWRRKCGSGKSLGKMWTTVFLKYMVISHYSYKCEGNLGNMGKWGEHLENVGFKYQQ